MPEWVLPSTVTALAVVIWYLARRIMAKQDELDRGINAKLDTIQQYMQTELRSFDVRLSVVETLVLPRK